MSSAQWYIGGEITKDEATNEGPMMNSNGKHNRRPARDPHYIEYWKGDRMLRDTGDGIDGAKRRIEARLARRHNRGERAIVYKNRVIVFDTHPDQPTPR